MGCTVGVGRDINVCMLLVRAVLALPDIYLVSGTGAERTVFPIDGKALVDYVSLLLTQ